MMMMSQLQRHPQRTQASSQQELAITHQGQATIPQGPAISQQTPAYTRLVQATSHQDLARYQVQATFRLALGRNTLPALVAHQDLARHQAQATSHQDLARHQVQATFRRAPGRNTLPALVAHQDLARRQVQVTFRRALGRNTLPALVAHQDLARRQVQATFCLVRARLQAIPPVQVTCHQTTLRAPASAASHPELLSILPDQAISLGATGLQGVAAVTEQACIHQGRARRHHMVQGGPSTQGQLQ